jgi:hypothetical protein
MQSSGKDSTGLLLGLAEAGRNDVLAVTYDPRFREREAPDAERLARRFGLAHRTVGADPVAEREALLRLLERAPTICADVALLAYTAVLERCGAPGGVVLDGLGSDLYMGYVPSRRDRLLAAVSLPRRVPALWGRVEPPALGARAAYLLKSMLMYPAERALAGSRLAPRTVRELLPADTVFSTFFAELDRHHRRRNPVDFRAYVRGRIYDGCGTMLKARLAAAHTGARAAFPWCDGALIDYCFHLPRSARYDARRGTNKHLLRELLRRDVGETRYLRHKGSFRYDVRRFVGANEACIRAELARARPLFEQLDRWGDFLLERRSSHVHAYALLTLFVLAAWLVRRPPEFVRPLLERADPGPAARIEVVP